MVGSPPPTGVLPLAILGAIAIALIVVANLVVYGAVHGSVDPRVASFQMMGAGLLLTALGVHLLQLRRERRRQAVSLLIARFMESHGGVTAAAERALEVLTAGGVAEAGVVGLVDDEAEMLRPIAALGYPRDWLSDINSRVISTELDLFRCGRELASDRWAQPVSAPLGGQPWVARIPLARAGVSLGLLLLVARRAGPLTDQRLLERLGDQLSLALDQAAMHEVGYQADRGHPEPRAGSPGPQG